MAAATGVLVVCVAVTTVPVSAAVAATPSLIDREIVVVVAAVPAGAVVGVKPTCCSAVVSPAAEPELSV